MSKKPFLQGGAINPTGRSPSREVCCSQGDLLLIAGYGHHLKQFRTVGVRVEGAFLGDVSIRVILAEDIQHPTTCLSADIVGRIESARVTVGHGPNHKFLSLSTGKKVTRRKFTEMPMTDSVIKMVDSLGKKERCKNGLSVKNKKGEEYTFDNEDEYEMIAEAKIPAPFPDIAAEAPGILTEQEEIMGVNEVIQSEREPSDEERVMLAAANSGIDFSAPPEDCPTKREIIEILDDEDNDILDQHINEESIQRQYEDKLTKIEEGEENDMSEEAVEREDDYRRSKQNKTANRQYQDYELYVTVEEQEDRPDYEEDDPKKMASVAHYVMMHYAEKESIKKK